MARIARLPVRFAYAAAVLGSLAFGATQAFASPAASKTLACGPGCIYRQYQCICL
jgi:hypothetical protein